MDEYISTSIKRACNLHLLIVSSIESTNEELLYTSRRENQMTREVTQTLIKEEKKNSGKCHKSTTGKKQHNNKHNCATMHKSTEDRISGSSSSHLKDTKI